MATKKFKSDVSLEQNISLPNKAASRALKIDSSGNLSESTVTEAELEALPSDVASAQADATQALSDAAAAQATADAAIPATEKGAANGVATLDANSKIPSSQIPAVAITDVFPVADIAARDALTVGSGDGEVQEGDVAVVTDASADPSIISGAASYIYSGSGWILLKSGDDVLSVAGKTGAVTLTAEDIAYAGGDLAGADVEAALDDAGSRILVLENATGGNVSDGDILETSATLADNQAVLADVTGLAFANATVRSFVVQLSVVRGSTYEVYTLTGVQKASSWDMSVEAVGDDTGMTFDITAAGQVQYTSTSTGNAPSVRFRADTTSVA